MKEVKIVCKLDYHCPIPYDRCDEVPLSVCLNCGELYVVKTRKDDPQPHD